MDEGKVKELVVDMDKYLLEKAGLDKCEDKEKKGKFNSCDCLTILRNNANRWAVARFSVKFMQRHRIEQSQTIIDWYRFASMQPGKKQFYIMPYDATDNGEVGDISDDLRSKKICRSAMMTLVQIGKDRMGNIKTQANITGTATEHGNKGKRKRLAETDPKLIGVRDHFASVELLATHNPRATRIIAKEVDGLIQRSTRDDDEDAVYLPFSMGIRSCYYRYLQEQGFDVKVNPDGTFKTTPTAGVQQKPFVSIATYYNIWKRDYDHIKVSRPVEDICALCYQFAHRAKYMTCLGVSHNSNNVNDDDNEDANDLNINSSIDDQLFREEEELIVSNYFIMIAVR